MNRHYLEEDLQLIQKYFPGAKTVRLRTPFDLTASAPRLLMSDVFRTEEDDTPHWHGGIVWSR